MPAEEALKKAQERELDLVEVAPLATPPVCKIMDFGNYLYSLKKKDKKQRKRVKKTETKTTRLSIRTEKHDLEVKAKQARKFLEERNLVKVVLIFRGREMAHQEIGAQLLKRVEKDLEEYGTVEQYPKMEGRQLIMVLAPKKK